MIPISGYLNFNKKKRKTQTNFHIFSQLQKKNMIFKTLFVEKVPCKTFFSVPPG